MPKSKTSVSQPIVAQPVSHVVKATVTYYVVCLPKNLPSVIKQIEEDQAEHQKASTFSSKKAAFSVHSFKVESVPFEKAPKNPKKVLATAKLGPLATAALGRPANHEQLSVEEQWGIDKKLGILDWDGSPNT